MSNMWHAACEEGVCDCMGREFWRFGFGHMTELLTYTYIRLKLQVKCIMCKILIKCPFFCCMLAISGSNIELLLTDIKTIHNRRL